LGSANINDRSMLGNRDSEIGVLVKDTDQFESSMGGKPWYASRFAHSLRCRLFSEHLGCSERASYVLVSGAGF
jgi:phospholipase D1/2